MNNADSEIARRRDIRYGRLIAGLDAGLETLYRQSGSCLDLLSPEDREIFHKAIEQLRGINQRAWSKV